MHRLILICASAVLGAIGVLSATHADDTEIFFARAAGTASAPASVMFMFDTSGSMDGYDGTDDQRIDRLKRAMIDVIDGGTNARIGIGAFNGRNRGGAILIPPVALDEDRCPGNLCNSVSVRVSVASSSDDGHEATDGSMQLAYDSMVMAEYVPSWERTTEFAYLGEGSDDAMEYAGGVLDTSSSKLELFGTTNSNIPTIGLRFTDVDVPPGAQILYADLGLVVPSGGNIAGEQHAQIRIDSAGDSPTFSTSPGNRILDRNYLPDVVEWQEINNTTTPDQKVYSTDISSLVQERAGRADWDQGDPMTFQLGISGDNHTSSGNRREFKTYESGLSGSAKTRLMVQYASAPVTSQTTGLRFSTVNIPRGANIERAWIEFIAHKSSSGSAILDIKAQDIGDAPVFGNNDYNLTARTTTTATANWTPDPWVQDERRENTSDISNVIQEVVNRNDWCGGNAMALFITGNGIREGRSYDKSIWDAPVLRVDYSPSSVDFNNSCLSKTVSAKVSGTINDVSEALDTGTVSTSGNVLGTSDSGSEAMLGLRFRNIQIPQGANVVDARLRLISAAPGTGTVNATVTGELTANSNAFSSLVSGGVSARSSTSQAVDWNNIEGGPEGMGVKSPNLTGLLNEIVSQPGWMSGNALSLRLEGRADSTGVRQFKSTEAKGPPALSVTYQLDGPALGGSTVTLRTGRDDLIDTMLDFRAAGGTPLIDAYYEAAAYMTGAEVEFGKMRGDQVTLDRYHRISASDTYTGGTVFRPAGCEAYDLDSIACINERIDSNPVYDAPPGSVCLANQIVLLTDGDARKNQARDLIKSMTSTSTCAARSNDREDCGLELGNWLANTDHSASITGTQSIVTNTVGFAFSSSFLSELAATSGGGFYTASTSADLSNVFSNIIRKTALGGSSFVAPTSAISQSNRLTNSNDLYFGQFAPKNTIKWGGNLKKYRLAASSSDASKTVVVGANNQPVLDADTGALLDTARSFWSTTTDGTNVELGGAAAQLELPRTVLTYTGSSTANTPLVALSETTSAITHDLLGINGASAEARTDLLQWARGLDVNDLDSDGNITEIREQMGDPLHSLPVIVNYPDRSLVFIGTNEGFLHAIDASDGEEAFAFIPRSLLPNLQKFYENDPGTDRIYGLDGPLVSWVDDNNHNNVVDGTEKAFVVAGMRRGGRDYYALDVTDPANPKVQWVIQGGSGDFAELGQSWSRPVKTRVNIAGTSREVLVFAAGYDEGNDDKVSRDFTDSQGRGIYIVDANTGARLAYKTSIDFTDMHYAIPSTPRVVDVDADSLADAIFVGDMGAQLWRFDIDNTVSGSLNDAISGGVIADFGGPSEVDNRRFYYEPDVALVSDDSSGQFLSIAIGSGFRAHPLDTNVENRFYLLRDRSVFGAPRNTSGTIAYTKKTESSLFDATSTPGSQTTSDKINQGWYISMTGIGEKVLSRAVTVNNQILFTTYLPESTTDNVCEASVGGGRVYAVDALYGNAVGELNNSTVLTNENRYRKLSVPGIPPGVSALIPEANPESPVLLVGPEVLPGLDFGALYRRTFWTER